MEPPRGWRNVPEIGFIVTNAVAGADVRLGARPDGDVTGPVTTAKVQ